MNINASSTLKYAQMMMQIASGKTDKASTTDGEFSLDVTAVEVVAETNEPQTVEDVKKEFYDYLDSLSLSPGLSTTPIAVNITEAAFEKMLADPEYKQKMKDLCARDLCDPAWGTTMLPSGQPLIPASIVVNIDADVEEEYVATSYNHPNDRDMADKGDSFWSRRTKKDKKAEKKADEKRAQEKREMLEFLQERADERKRMFGMGGDFAIGGASSFHAYSATRSQPIGAGPVSGLI